MNYIILLLEFIVLITSIGLFISKSEMVDGSPRIDINWNIALFITVILMIGINIRFICYGAYCFFSCGDESAEVQDAKKAVAIYRRAKAGKSLKAGLFGYENVDLNNLNQDDEETEFLGVSDPTEIKKIAEQNTKTLLQQNIADRQAVSKERVQARVQEHAAALKNRPNAKETAFTPHAIQVGGPLRTQGVVLAKPDEPLKPQMGGVYETKADHPFEAFGFGKLKPKPIPAGEEEGPLTYKKLGVQRPIGEEEGPGLARKKSIVKAKIPAGEEEGPGLARRKSIPGGSSAQRAMEAAMRGEGVGGASEEDEDE